MDLEKIQDKNQHIVLSFRLIFPNSPTLSAAFTKSKPGSIYNKIYQEYFDPNYNFNLAEKGLEILMKVPETALYDTAQEVLSKTAYHCKVMKLNKNGAFYGNRKHKNHAKKLLDHGCSHFGQVLTACFNCGAKEMEIQNIP